MPSIDSNSLISGLSPAGRSGPLNDSTIFAQGLDDSRKEAFDSALRRALGGDQQAKQSPRQVAEEFIAIALVQPVLEQLRETNQAAEPFAPSDVEKRFGPMFDAEIAHRMVKSSNWGLVDSVATRLERNAAARAETQQIRGVDANG